MCIAGVCHTHEPLCVGLQMEGDEEGGGCTVKAVGFGGTRAGGLESREVTTAVHPFLFLKCSPLSIMGRATSPCSQVS